MKPRLCRKTPSSARERAVFSPGKDGEAGDVCFIVDTAGCSQVEKGPLEARSGFPTEPNLHGYISGFSFNLQNVLILCLGVAILHQPFVLNPTLLIQMYTSTKFVSVKGEFPAFNVSVLCFFVTVHGLF